MYVPDASEGVMYVPKFYVSNVPEVVCKYLLCMYKMFLKLYVPEFPEGVIYVPHTPDVPEGETCVTMPLRMHVPDLY